MNEALVLERMTKDDMTEEYLCSLRRDYCTLMLVIDWYLKVGDHADYEDLKRLKKILTRSEIERP